MAINVNYLNTTSSSSLYSKLQHQTPPTFSTHVFQVKALLGGAKTLIESGKVRAIVPKEAAAAISSSRFVLLDVRPEWERQKAHVTGSLHVPFFVEDKDNGPVTLLKKWVHFGYIGLWTGQAFTTINPEFLNRVRGVVPDQDSSLLVACGEGLRSMMAVSKLHEAGYKNLAWLAGGFNRAGDGDFPVEGTEKLQYAAIGGVSYYFLKLLLLIEAAGKSQ
ncbi:hypothetical protein Droror1_Dr00012111 [Drosera rotundifolia]